MCKVINVQENVEKLCGEVIKVDYITPLGDIDPDKGRIGERGVKNKILTYVQATGSTVGSYILYALSKRGNSPKAILCIEIDFITLVGCILGDINLIEISREEYDKIRDGSRICIETDKINRDKCSISEDV